VAGDLLRGTLNSTESDFFSFSGTQGQTLLLDNWITGLFDSTGPINVRIHAVPNPADPSTDQIVCASAMYVNFILFTLPVSGTYYVEFNGGNSGQLTPYVIRSAV